MVSSGDELNLAAFSSPVGEAALTVSTARERTKKVVLSDIVIVSDGDYRLRREKTINLVKEWKGGEGILARLYSRQKTTSPDRPTVGVPLARLICRSLCGSIGSLKKSNL